MEHLLKEIAPNYRPPAHEATYNQLRRSKQLNIEARDQGQLRGTRHGTQNINTVLKQHNTYGHSVAGRTHGDLS